jgi:hypothetical protein
VTDRRGFLRRALALPGPPVTDMLPDASALPLVTNVETPTLTGQLRRLLATVESFGPLGGEVGHALRLATAGSDPTSETTEAMQAGLDRACLVGVHINPEMRVKVVRGPAQAELATEGWRPFLVKVHNEAGTTARLRATSAQGGGHARRWLDLALVQDGTLSGSALEYRVLRLFSRESGRREASLAFDVGQGSQDLGFRNEVPILFDCRPGGERIPAPW